METFKKSLSYLKWIELVNFNQICCKNPKTFKSFNGECGTWKICMDFSHIYYKISMRTIKNICKVLPTMRVMYVVQNWFINQFYKSRNSFLSLSSKPFCTIGVIQIMLVLLFSFSLPLLTSFRFHQHKLEWGHSSLSLKNMWAKIYDIIWWLLNKSYNLTMGSILYVLIFIYILHVCITYV